MEILYISLRHYRWGETHQVTPPRGSCLGDGRNTALSFTLSFALALHLSPISFSSPFIATGRDLFGIPATQTLDNFPCERQLLEQPEAAAKGKDLGEYYQYAPPRNSPRREAAASSYPLPGSLKMPRRS